MTKQDWIEVLNTSGSRDVLDIIVIAVSIISPILVFVSVLYAAKAANAAKRATDLNIKLFEEQKNEKEKLRNAAHRTELSKLNRSLYFLPLKINPINESEKIGTYNLIPFLELSLGNLSKVDVSVFSYENQDDINYIALSIGTRLAELKSVVPSNMYELNKIDNQLSMLSNLITDLFNNIEENTDLK